MMQIMPILVADESALKDGPEGELRALQVKAFRLYAVFYKAFMGVHTAVAIPRTRGGELVAKGTFVKASPRERWYSDVALLNDKGGDCCNLTGCTQLHKTVEDVRFSMVELKSLQRVVHVCPSYSNKKALLATAHPDDVFCFHEINFLPSRLPKSYIPDKRNVVERIVSVGILFNATGSCSAVPLVVLEPSNRPERRRASAASRKVAVRRDRNTIILTIHKAHHITGKVAPPVAEHGFSVQHLTNTRVVNIRGSVPETGLPHLQGVGDALKAYYRVMVMRRAIASKRFQFDYSASIADVDYSDILEWVGEAWTRVRTATMQRSWWRAGCVPASWPPLMAYLGDTCATSMFEPIISVCVDSQLLIEKFKVKPACYMTTADFINCDAGLCLDQGFRATPAASASDDSSGDMSLPDGPLLRDECSKRRVIRNVTNAYVERADELGIPPAAMPAEVGASNQKVISRLCRTPVKRARAGGRAENGTAEEVLRSDEVLESDDDQ
ncbi:unnamed protein product [Closterium sp. NIES-65]|nr:unnamed protein product [Closterium sp. NIES-65]